MAEITASKVKELRERTGAGMMDCKEALQEVGGDLEEAIVFLRKKMGNKLERREGRVTAEGVVATFISGSVAAIVELVSVELVRGERRISGCVDPLRLPVEILPSLIC